VARLRRSWYARRPHIRRVLDRPVISVGNLVVGGSGKTPLVAALAHLLLRAGERPSVLSRGYARRRASEGVLVVSDADGIRAPVEQSGDEPQMLARMLPGVSVVVAADRYLAGALAERRLGCTVHVLDDGFQHLQLARAVDLLVVHPDDLDDRVLPAGRLREPPDAARCADALLIAGTLEDAEEVSASLGVSPAFRVEPRHAPARWLRPETIEGPGPSGGRVVAVTGIARPQRFFDALRELGFDVAQEMPFSDHHWFSDADLARIAQAVVDTTADGVMTTEKDAVRLGSDRNLVPVWAVLPLEMAIEPAEAFEPWLLDRLFVGTGTGRPARRGVTREGLVSPSAEPESPDRAGRGGG
jgi:tetraacyldisaccharide 4'-kinase